MARTTVKHFHGGTGEYFTPMANTCPRGDSHHQLEGMFKKHVLAEAGSPSSKAAAILTRGAYMEYVSTAKWRERRWRLFSTFPWCEGSFDMNRGRREGE
jgi:hypothetical protein